MRIANVCIILTAQAKDPAGGTLKINNEEEMKDGTGGPASNISGYNTESTTTTFSMNINYKLCFHGCNCKQ